MPATTLVREGAAQAHSTSHTTFLVRVARQNPSDSNHGSIIELVSSRAWLPACLAFRRDATSPLAYSHHGPLGRSVHLHPHLSSITSQRTACVLVAMRQRWTDARIGRGSPCCERDEKAENARLLSARFCSKSCPWGRTDFYGRWHDGS
jgi:hypothetical protein